MVYKMKLLLTQSQYHVSYFLNFSLFRSSPIAQLIKNPPAMQETPVRFLGWENPLEKGMAPHSSILA